MKPLRTAWLSRGSTRTTPPAGTEVAAQGPHYHSRASASPEAGVRISPAPSTPSLPLSPICVRARRRPGAIAFAFEGGEGRASAMATKRIFATAVLAAFE